MKSNRNGIYYILFLVCFSITANASVPFIVEYSAMYREVNTVTSGCYMTFEVLFNSSVKAISNITGQTGAVSKMGEYLKMSMRLSVAVNGNPTFNVDDQDNVSYFIVMPEQCIQNPTLDIPDISTKQNLYFFNIKMYNLFFYVLKIPFNSDYFGYGIIIDANRGLRSVYQTAVMFNPTPLFKMYFTYNTPNTQGGGLFNIIADLYGDQKSFSFYGDLPSAQSTATFNTTSFVNIPELRMYTFQVSNLIPKERVIANSVSALRFLQCYFVSGDSTTATYLGHYLGTGLNDPVNTIGPLQVQIIAQGLYSPILYSFSYTITGVPAIINPNCEFSLQNGYELPYSIIKMTVVNQQLTNIIGDIVSIDKPMNYYPYGYQSGTYSQMNYTLNLLLAPFAQTQFTKATLGGSSKTLPFNYTVDTIAPSIVNIRFYTIMDNPDLVLVHIMAMDNLSGISKFLLENVNEPITNADRSSGDTNYGIYEKFYSINSVSIQQITTYDWAMNYQIFQSYYIFNWPSPLRTFDINSITKWYFEKYEVDVSENGTYNTLYFIYPSPDITRTFGFKLIYSYELATQFSSDTADKLNYDIVKWNPLVNMFSVEFYIPPRMFSGNLNYIFSADGTKHDPSIFSTIVGPNSTLSVISTASDELPPLVSSISIYPNATVSVGSTPIEIGYKIEFTETLNGFESLNVTISSDMHPIGYQKITKLSGGISYEVTVSITINPSECVPQTFYIKEVTTRDRSGHFASSTYRAPTDIHPTVPNPFIKVPNYKTQTIQVLCTNPPENDGTGPELLDFSVSTQEMDVSVMNRELVISFNIYDPTGISDANIPIIFLESSDPGQLRYEVPATIFQELNSTFESYTTKIQVPFKFGGKEGFGISVFGLVDKLLNIKGYTFGDLRDMGFNSIVRTNINFNGPMIESTSPYNALGGLIAIYGRGFGSDASPVMFQVLIKDSTGTKTFTIDTIEFFSGIYIRIRITKPTLPYYYLGVKVGNITSNWVLVGVYTPPTETPVNPPKCPGSPNQCSGNGQCIISGQQASCQCKSPFAGDDCSYQIFIVPQPTVNPTEPNSTIITPPITGSEEPSGEVIFYTSLVSIRSIREIQIDQTIHEYNFTQWLYKDISTDVQTDINPRKVYQYLSNITHPVFHSVTLVNVTIEWFDSYTNITFADQLIQMTPSTIKYRIQLSPYQFERATNTMDIQFLVSLSSNYSDSCSTQKQGVVFENDFVKLEMDKQSFYGRFIKRALIDGRNRVISNTIQPQSQLNSESSSIVSIHIPNYKDYTILDPDFTLLINSDPITSGTEGSLCNSSSKDGLSKTKIAGIVIGCVGFAIIAVISTSYYIYKKKRQANYVKKLNVKLKAANNEQ
ncbi:hypothetical protein DLAC_02370 [Tieghemostelium lacteum]|uniref:EGF-like domain-containing protein n=1 Tax=Tieghemostelium lacteum TaxID=361077 RepID=A0A152A588_TIELA|nr:hypothetical protein DLAC_02370 [Tieghemostelium lacteum]|eukprot:KYR01251.1 hypothetical protein DLAC_02370 [Tieghemostelium lacteum]